MDFAQGVLLRLERLIGAFELALRRDIFHPDIDRSHGAVSTAGGMVRKHVFTVAVGRRQFELLREQASQVLKGHERIFKQHGIGFKPRGLLRRIVPTHQPGEGHAGQVVLAKIAGTLERVFVGDPGGPVQLHKTLWRVLQNFALPSGCRFEAFARLQEQSTPQPGNVVQRL